MNKILSFICSHLRFVATTIYSLILIIIFIFPPNKFDIMARGFSKFVYLFSEDARFMEINSTIFYSEIVIASLIYFAFMLFVIKK